MKNIAIMCLIAISGLLAGCEAKTSVVNAKYVIPEGLKDCNIYYMRSSDATAITVVRCPNSSTSTNYRAGKTTQNTTVIDGDE